MVCIFCQSETEVTNSRAKVRSPSVWRRRSCKLCATQFTTIEVPDYEKSLSITDQLGNKHPFTRDKLLLSLHKSLSHRDDALSAASALTNTVIGRLIDKKYVTNGAISNASITRVSYEVLKRFDPLSAATYKAYHQSMLKKT